MPKLGPVTEAMFAQQDENGPPAIAEEWHRAVTSPGDVILFWGGAARQSHGNFSWTDMTTRIRSEDGSDDLVTTTPPEHVERMLSVMGHASRVRIMQALYHEGLASGDLAERVGLRGGSLYHHLRELLHAAYVDERKGRYSLTTLGRQMLVSMTVLAHRTVVDEGDRGLGVGVHEGGDGGA